MVHVQMYQKKDNGNRHMNRAYESTKVGHIPEYSSTENASNGTLVTCYAILEAATGATSTVHLQTYVAEQSCCIGSDSWLHLELAIVMRMYRLCS